MELTIALAISILSITFTIISFANNRKDKAIKDTKEESSNQKLIEYRLGALEKKLDQVLEKLDRYDSEIEERITKAMENHINQFHK